MGYPLTSHPAICGQFNLVENTMLYSNAYRFIGGCQ